MGTGEPTDGLDVQGGLAELADEVAKNTASIAALRGDAGRAQEQADATDKQADQDRARIGVLESRADVDREVVRTLQAEGLLHREQTANLERALHTSRLIGAALGIIIVNHKTTEAQAFTLLSRASQNTNRKIHVLAQDIVDTGDTQLLASL